MNTAWVMPFFGVLIMTVGAYAGGGTAVTCTRIVPKEAPAETVDPSKTFQPTASCRVRTTRWLGRSLVDERTYLRVTSVDQIAVSRTESSGSTSRTVDDWSLQLMDNQSEVVRIAAARDQVSPSHDRAIAWFAGPGDTPLDMDLTDWRFSYAAMGFGAFWMLATGMIAKSMGKTAQRRARREGKTRVEVSEN